MKLTEYADQLRAFHNARPGSCPICGKTHKRSVNGPCPACHMRKYRSTKKGRAISRAANDRWTKKWWASLTPEEKLAYGRARRERDKRKEKDA